ncbi:High-affinity inorganic phosphate (Pi) transporter and low-affinity manganese transporter [Komagataella phaffii CBS 7435]|uniref:High-affinity inorganic phosphate (Pi) transporter and low-affinity manganese transporter n=2 Tax=Komagataella phaffii TaxID=460519 RepID=C4R3N5_KOMPG|nr:High-affinity inorganic phosphate (Pi) transporter and low-affinity manganese transporter [Komagataella phaffii GS115]AOA64265.1 GQ67_03158T0 [Komagataella phaffii]CAH2450163.1 High-affinity inorganic phosphate (Pi) transporter and low-affinity manganese transporter [Komagataella phaffii CBS 7435]AOA68949.1 GQ68_03143T0 [Komagataella phaffii GS115]CAY70089.1 High-affinity inorganic phosphate (Pi) transporter and low-affinity manganese transporter [Komagataella phaffii GS115]CCA40038.1 High-
MSSEPVMQAKTKSKRLNVHNLLDEFDHIEDPFERRRLALEKIDNAKFSLYHVRAIMVGGIGFLTDSYDIFAINLATSMLGYVYWGGAHGGTGRIPSSTESLMKVSTSVGTVLGQVVFGKLCDYVGRKIWGIELIIMITATILQVCAGESPAVNFVALLTFYRIVMGIGIGADYSLSSTITSEYSTKNTRGMIMAAVFANQGWGQLLAGIVALICVVGWKSDLIDATNASECVGPCVLALDKMWRVLVGFGAVPGCIALYFRLTTPESPRYKLHKELQAYEQQMARQNDKMQLIAAENANNETAAAPLTFADRAVLEEEEEEHKVQPATWADFWNHYRQWKYGKFLIGTAGSWFLLDVAFYGLNLNSAVILQAIGFASDENVYEKLYNVCAGNLILICAGALPGYWVSVATIDTLGRKFIQLMGFIVVTALFCAIGFAYDKLSDKGLLGLYIIVQFFINFGPNCTTYIYPVEIHPTRFRSTAHGISSASGKIGAIIAQTVLGTLINHGCSADKPNCFLPHVMEIFALFMLLGVGTTLLLPETKKKSLEAIGEIYHGELNPDAFAADEEDLSSSTGVDQELVNYQEQKHV